VISEKVAAIDLFAEAVASIFTKSLALLDESSLLTFSGDKTLSALPKKKYFPSKIVFKILPI
jgi:hypothetical protein